MAQDKWTMLDDEADMSGVLRGNEDSQDKLKKLLRTHHGYSGEGPTTRGSSQANDIKCDCFQVQTYRSNENECVNKMITQNQDLDRPIYRHYLYNQQPNAEIPGDCINPIFEQSF